MVRVGRLDWVLARGGRFPLTKYCTYSSQASGFSACSLIYLSNASCTRSGVPDLISVAMYAR